MRSGLTLLCLCLAAAACAEKSVPVVTRPDPAAEKRRLDELELEVALLVDDLECLKRLELQTDWFANTGPMKSAIVSRYVQVELAIAAVRRDGTIHTPEGAERFEAKIVEPFARVAADIRAHFDSTGLQSLCADLATLVRMLDALHEERFAEVLGLWRTPRAPIDRSRYDHLHADIRSRMRKAAERADWIHFADRKAMEKLPRRQQLPGPRRGAPLIGGGDRRRLNDAGAGGEEGWAAANASSGSS